MFYSNLVKTSVWKNWKIVSFVYILSFFVSRVLRVARKQELTQLADFSTNSPIDRILRRQENIDFVLDGSNTTGLDTRPLVVHILLVNFITLSWCKSENLDFLVWFFPYIEKNITFFRVENLLFFPNKFVFCCAV